MKLSLHFTILACSFLIVLNPSAAADLPVVDVEVIHVDPADIPDFTDSQVMENALQDWKQASDRMPDLLLEACPPSCQDVKTKEEWFVYPDAARLALCNKTMLLDFAVHQDIKDNHDKSAMRACTADFGSLAAQRVQAAEIASVCSTPNHAQIEVPIQISGTGHLRVDKNAAAGLRAAGEQIHNYLSAAPIKCNTNTIAFGYSAGAVMGLYAGGEVHHQKITLQVLEALLSHVEEGTFPETLVAQLCHVDGRGADYAIGIVASTSGDLPYVQDAVKAWTDGKCVSGLETGQELIRITLNVPDIDSKLSRRTAETSFSRNRLAIRADCKTTKVIANDGCWAVAQRCGISEANLTKFNPRSKFCNTLVVGETVCCSSGTLPDTTPPANADGTCKVRKVESGDSCGLLASKCGVSGTDFTKFNPGATFCATLTPGQHVCCGRGKLPDFVPKPNKDGSCFVYQVKADDSCARIAASYGLTVALLESFNKNSWGWNGCKTLWVGINLCLSTGSSPMPAAVSNAVCGPTVVGTKMPTGNTKLADLNPCPLKTCCNVWGQCGTTSDFCTVSKSETGAPGTSAPGTTGCISNCGTHIVAGSPPASKIKVAYFEAWNPERPCLHMNVDQIDTSRYTHIHFAFADLTPDFKVDISKVKGQFDRFKAMKNIKRIISFGGWEFSTAPGTYKILRNAVKYENRNAFRANLLSFVAEHNLDGVDLDWEYPGAPDIPGVPTGDPAEGMDYFTLLFQLKSTMPVGKTVSFAAPASYWYLKAFPMEPMGAYLDYIIYMTYDLHGQWDHGNQWTSPGCPGGNCLRSHVNLTETLNALSMITKAGVASNKVVVGVTSYGRSFRMSTAGCTGPQCTFTGSRSVSNAAKGRCTGTSGYISNAEIDEIKAKGNFKSYQDSTHSSILVYNDMEWVAYMDDTVKAQRESMYDLWNFAGTTDWAVDLQKFLPAGGNDNGGSDDEEQYEEDGWDGEYVNKPRNIAKCISKYQSLSQIEKDTSKIPPHCMTKYLAQVEGFVLGQALNSYDKLMQNGYDKKFNIYSKSIRSQIPFQIYKYMAGAQKTGFFRCTESKWVLCCISCSSACGTKENPCANGSNCKTGFQNIVVDCPTMLSNGGWETNNYVPNITYTLTNENGFYKDIAAKYGIEKSWIKWGRRRAYVHTGCGRAADIKACQEKNDVFWKNYPLPADDIEIPNPKTLIKDMYAEMRKVKNQLDISNEYADVARISREDLVDAGSLPALMMQFAVKSMDTVVETANEIIEAERKALIANFLMAVLMFIPMAGSAAGAAGMTVVRSLLTLAGEAAAVGSLIYEVVDDPDNALLVVFGYLLGGGVSRQPFREAAAARRSMKSAEVQKLGPIKKDLDRIDNLKGKSCKAKQGEEGLGFTPASQGSLLRNYTQDLISVLV